MRSWVLGVLVTLVFALAAAPAQAAPIPPPEQYFGFEIGTTGKLARFSKLQDYYELAAQRSNRLEYQNLGKTVLGHDYPFLLASSPKNLQRVDEILAANERLANPRGLSEEAARELASKHVPVYYLEGGMHSTEVAPVQVLANVVHRLATEKSPEIDRILDELLIVIVPAANPDGSHLVTDYFNETEGTAFRRTYPDLYHHYTGHDDNRDWLFFTQPESKIRINIFKRYRPVVEHILHQAGGDSPRMWTPPYNEPLGKESPRDSIQLQSSNALGLQVNRGLLAQDKKGVKWGDAYGIWNAADIASFETFMGSALLLFELASTRDLALPTESEDGEPIGEQGRTMRNMLPYDKSTWTLEQMVDYMETGVWLALDAVSREPERWSYENLYQVPRNAINSKDGPYAYVLPAGQRDPYAVYDLLNIFDQSLVEIDRATAEFSAGGTTYPAGSYVLRTRQPLGKWVDQLLDNAPYPDEGRNCSSCPLVMPYSEATDNVAMMLGVDAQAIKDPFNASLERVTDLTPASVMMPLAPPRDGAYLVEPDSYGVARFLADLQKADVPVFRASEDFSAGGRDYEPGTLVVPPSARSRAVLQATSQETGLQVYAADAAPQVDGFELKPGTRVGLIRGANNMPGGWVMWQLDQHEVDYEVVTADDYEELSAKFDTILLPDGISRQRIVEGLDPDEVPERFHWARGVGEEGWAQLAAFVQDGGTLVALGSSGETARQLLNLPIQRVQPTGLRVPGSLMRVETNEDVPETWGMPEEWTTWFDGDAAFRVLDASRATAATTYPQDGDPLLSSGYAEGAEGLRGLADIVTADVGEGHVVLSGTDLNFRTWPRVAWTVVANAIYHGPSEPVSQD